VFSLNVLTAAYRNSSTIWKDNTASHLVTLNPTPNQNDTNYNGNPYFVGMDPVSTQSIQMSLDQ